MKLKIRAEVWIEFDGPGGRARMQVGAMDVEIDQGQLEGALTLVPAGIIERTKDQWTLPMPKVVTCLRYALTGRRMSEVTRDP